MLTPQHRQEQLSRAYVAAIAASVGMNFSTRDFDYGIDLTLHEVTTRTNPSSGKKRLVESGRTLDIQIKSTTMASMDQEHIAYDLDVNGYDDLRDERVQTPRILVLHVQPSEEADRVYQTPSELKLGGCCYWVSLKGLGSITNTATTRIRIPRCQEFSAVQLEQIMARIKQGEPL